MLYMFFLREQKLSLKSRCDQRCSKSERESQGTFADLQYIRKHGQVRESRVCVS
jgi:hypothetical protein